MKYPIKLLISTVVRMERKDRTSRGGGIAIYLRDHLNYTVRRDIVDYGIEIICIEIAPLKCRPFITVAWYRPPSYPMSLSTYLKRFSLSLIGKKKKSFLLEVLIVIFGTELLLVTTIPCIYQMFIIFFSGN